MRCVGSIGTILAEAASAVVTVGVVERRRRRRAGGRAGLAWWRHLRAGRLEPCRCPLSPSTASVTAGALGASSAGGACTAARPSAVAVLQGNGTSLRRQCEYLYGQQRSSPTRRAAAGPGGNAGSRALKKTGDGTLVLGVRTPIVGWHECHRARSGISADATGYGRHRGAGRWHRNHLFALLRHLQP